MKVFQFFGVELNVQMTDFALMNRMIDLQHILQSDFFILQSAWNSTQSTVHEDFVYTHTNINDLDNNFCKMINCWQKDSTKTPLLGLTQYKDNGTTRRYIYVRDSMSELYTSERPMFTNIVQKSPHPLLHFLNETLSVLKIPYTRVPDWSIIISEDL
jgi:hypothetical protein